MSLHNIDYDQLLDQFEKEYDFLYDHRDRVAGYHEALRFGEVFMKIYKNIVSEFNSKRGDILTSDREVAAFAFALEALGYIELLGV